tara:strand:+ start:724 stop:1248 length:525 start_codon:yes stop_codon:yes gene_type:complete
MKVKIGPYPDYKWYHNYLFELFGYSPKQTVNVKLDKWDTWSMDHTLAKIVLPMLYQLAKTKHGSPRVDNKDVPAELRGDDEYLIHERWDWVMSEMIFSFETKLAEEDWQDQFFSGESDLYNVPVLSSQGKVIAFEVKHGPNDTLKIDYDGLREYQERITNGFRLFGQYYEGLWD